MRRSSSDGELEVQRTTVVKIFCLVRCPDYVQLNDR